VSFCSATVYESRSRRVPRCFGVKISLSVAESPLSLRQRLRCPISCPVDASRCLGSWLDLTTTHWQTWLFSSTSTYHSSDLLTARGVAHLVVHGTTGSTSYKTIPPVQLETSGGVLSTVDMVVQRRDGPRQLRDHDDERRIEIDRPVRHYTKCETSALPAVPSIDDRGQTDRVRPKLHYPLPRLTTDLSNCCVRNKSQCLQQTRKF